MAGTNLINYVKDGLKKGYTKQELEKILLENNWSSQEITEAFNTIQTKKDLVTSTSPRIVPQNKNHMLDNFIRRSLDRGIPEDRIRNVLVKKGWPIAAVNEAISGSKSQGQDIVKVHKPKKPIMKKTLLHVLWFVIISVVLTAGVGIFFYIQGMNSYIIIDPSTGQQVSGKCLQEDCSDLREYINGALLDNLVLILSIALSIALILVLLHLFIPQKEWVIWIANILFFVYILYLLYLWFFGGI